MSMTVSLTMGMTKGLDKIANINDNAAPCLQRPAHTSRAVVYSTDALWYLLSVPAQ